MSESSPPETMRDEAGSASRGALRTISALGTETFEAFHAASSLNDLLRAAAVHCRRLVGAEAARIWIARRGGRRLVAREISDHPDQPPIERRIARGEGLAGWVVAHGTSLRLGADDPRPDLKGEIPPFRSALVLPLLRRGQVFGAIECLNRSDANSFSDTDFDHLEVASEHIAIALDNALLFEKAERRALEKEVLLEVSRTLAAPLDLDGVIEAFFESLHQVVDYDAAAIFLIDPDSHAIGLVRQIGYPEGSEEMLQVRLGHGIVGWVADAGEPAIVPDVRRDERYVEARAETRSELAAPLIAGGRTIGVFNLESDLCDAYHEGHLEIVKAFAAQAAVAVERVRIARELMERRHLERELAVARSIQLSFLPKAAPLISGYEVAGTARPHDEVGGDYYDFIRVSGTRLGLAIADSSGKGVPAALLMAGFRASLLAEIRNEFAIRAVMRKVNSLLHESIDRERFVTAFYGVLDIKNSVLMFSNAGHNPPILMRRDGKVEYLLEGGVTLGVLPDAQFEDRPVAIRPGDVLVLYTDGVSEAESPSGEHFGTLRIEQCVARLADRSAEEILQGLVDDVLAWAGARGQSDDLTLMVVKRLPEEE